LVSQLLENPDTTSDDEQLMMTHGLMGCLLEQTGERSESEVHLAIADRLCNPQRQLSAALRFGYDLVSVCRAFHARNLANLGHVDTALAAARDAVTLAHRVGHSLTITTVLYVSAGCWVILREPAGAASFAEEAMARARDHGFAFWESEARAALGWASALQAGARAGVSEIREAIGAVRSMGVERDVMWMLGRLSEAELATGDPNAAAEAANEALRWGEENNLYTLYGYLHRTRGDAMVALGDLAQAEEDYHRALVWSRGRNEKWGELNAALRLARLWRVDGRARDARELLAPVYGWFTEGFNNPVLRDAKALLEELTGKIDSDANSDRPADPSNS